MFWLLLNYAPTASGLSFTPSFPQGIRLGVGKTLGGNTDWKIVPNWPKRYSTPDVMIRNERDRGRRGMGW